MNSQRIPWFWPVSFLAALGQLLLLLTDNRGGPEAARIALAVWTLWLPGAWLGHLLTKPGTRLPRRLPVEASCALGVAALLLSVRTAGVDPDLLALAATAVSVILALAHLLGPGAQSPRRRRIQEPRPSGGESAAVALALVVGAALAAVHLGTGAPLAARPDAPQHLAAAQWSAAGEGVYPPRPYHPEWGTPGFDGERGLGPAMVDLVARLADQDAAVVWDFLPALFAPLIFFAMYATGRALLGGAFWALWAALLHLAVFTLGFSGGELTDAGFPDHMALVPFWTALALYIDGQDRPHLPGVLAFGLSSMAVWALHGGLGFVLLLVMAAVGLRILTSVERFQEGFPLLVSLWIPWALFTGSYVGVRWLATGSPDPFALPAAGLLALGSGWIVLDPSLVPRTLLVAAAVAWLFSPVLLRPARRRAGSFFLVGLTVAAPAALLNPWVVGPAAAGWGDTVHLLPWAVPLGFVLTAELRWGWRGLAEARGTTWLRLLVVAGAAAAALAIGWTTLTDPAYRPDRMRALRKSPPEHWSRLAAAVRDTIPPGTTILAEPQLATYLAARGEVRSALEPAVFWDATEAEARWLLAREATLAPRADPAHWVAAHAAGFLVVSGLGPVATSPEEAPRDTTATGRSGPAAAPVPGPLRELRKIDLGPDGAAYFLTGLGGTGDVAAGEPPAAPWRRTGEGGPRILAAGVDTARVRPGETLTVIVRWRGPERPGAEGRFGYRVRIELEPERAIGAQGPVARLLRRGLRAFSVDRRVWSVTVSLAGETPPWWWPAMEFTESIPLLLPGDLEPGTYRVRAEAVPVAGHSHRIRDGLAMLDGAPLARIVVFDR